MAEYDLNNLLPRQRPHLTVGQVFALTSAEQGTTWQLVLLRGMLRREPGCGPVRVALPPARWGLTEAAAAIPGRHDRVQARPEVAGQGGHAPATSIAAQSCGRWTLSMRCRSVDDAMPLSSVSPAGYYGPEWSDFSITGLTSFEALERAARAEGYGDAAVAAAKRAAALGCTDAEIEQEAVAVQEREDWRAERGGLHEPVAWAARLLEEGLLKAIIDTPEGPHDLAKWQAIVRRASVSSCVYARSSSTARSI